MAPAERLARPAQVVGACIGGHVGGIDSNVGDIELSGRSGCSRTQDDRSGEVHQVGMVVGDRGPYWRARQADTEAWVERKADRWHPHDGKVGPDARQSPSRLGGDHERLVTARRQLLGDAHRRAGDAVDIGRE